MSRISSPSRSTWSSAPGCGPDAVAIAPVTTITAQPTTPTTATSRSQRGATGAPSPRAWPHASSATTTASATTTSASRKCVITASGWRSRITVRPPSGICATVPRNAASAVRRTHGVSPATRRAASQVDERGEDPAEATTRLPNSTIAWKSFAGNGVSTAARPVVAPEPRAGEPDERARGDDEPEHRRPRAGRSGGTRRARRARGGARAASRERDPRPGLDATHSVEREPARRRTSPRRRRACRPAA